MKTYDAKDVVISFDGVEASCFGKLATDEFRVVGPEPEEITPEQRESRCITFTVEIDRASMLHAFFGPHPNPVAERDLEGSWLWQ